MAQRLELHGAWRRSIGGRDIDFVSVPGCYPPVGECTLSYEFSLPDAFRQEGEIRWRLEDAESIQVMLALSVWG